jgi:RNA polymerase sigma-70 factor (ECF subfamily)
MDPELVMRAQRGDEVAFAAITQASHGRLKQVAYRILRDRHLAEDAMQQALVEMWRKLPTLNDPARFDAWSYRVLVRACYREAKRHRRSFGQIPGKREPVELDGTAAVNDRDQLERGFAHLSVDHRAVVVMHYYLDLTIEDTAATLGISVGTAKSRLNRAMTRLRTALHADAHVSSTTEPESTS